MLHIITRMDRGGSAVNTLATCIGLCETHTIVLACGLSAESAMTRRERRLVQEGIEEAERKGVEVRPIPALVRRIRPVEDMKALWALFRLVRQKRPDIVHTHSSKAGLLGRCAAWLAGAPHIVHTPHGHVFYGHFGPAASRLFLALERMAGRVTDRTVALTGSERDDYVRLGVGRPEALSVIHSGVDIGRFEAPAGDPDRVRRSLGIDAKTFVVGFVGWLLPIKDPVTLLDAMEQVRQHFDSAVAVFAGKGQLAAELKKRVNASGAQNRVVFAGWRPDVPALMHAFDVLVLPSRNEGMGRVLVEAMAAGKPVIGSRTGGIPDLIRHGQNGYLFEPGSAGQLADRILRLAQDPDLRRQMGEKGRSMAKAYSTESMIQKLGGLYTALLHNRPASGPSHESKVNPAQLD